MLARMLSVRRPAHESSTNSSDVVEATTTPDPEADDDSKTRKSYTNRNLTTRFRLLCPCLIIILFSIPLFFWIPAFLTRSRALVCTPFDPTSRLGLSGFGGTDSEFGSLGVPWCRSKQGKTVEWTAKDLLKGLEDFIPIYETRPIPNNQYGMGFDHSFGLWFIANSIQPELMIESGTFKGHSTWVLRQAMPYTRIVSLSPRHPVKYLRKGPAYVDANCTYLAGKDFIDFGSVNWKAMMRKHGVTDYSRVLIFFDDHQNELKRIKQALKAGFQHLVFEDNYDTGTGDHYSLRQICDQIYIRGGGHSCFKDSDEARIRAKRKGFWDKAVDINELCGSGEEWWGVRGYMRDDFNHTNQAITYEEHYKNSRYVESVLDAYWELPPVAGPSLTHQTRYDPARAPNPIVEDGKYGLFQRLGLSRLDKSVFNGYTQTRLDKSKYQKQTLRPVWLRGKEKEKKI